MGKGKVSLAAAMVEEGRTRRAAGRSSHPARKGGLTMNGDPA
jgi:hypothetical protein